MTARIEQFLEKKLIGIRILMSLAENQTFNLWSNFMPRRNEINNKVGNELYSLQVYPNEFFEHFNPNTMFEKWATVEVNNFDFIPKNMDVFVLNSGLYAIFHYIGAASKASPTFQYIFQDWIPNSKYELDNRPHFEVLGSKYKNEDPLSEEEIWIPIRPKKRH